MKLFEGLRDKTARIRMIQAEQGDIVELTTSALLCFGLMTDPRIQFKSQSLRIQRQCGSSKKYFVKVELKNGQYCFREIMDYYRIKIVEEKNCKLFERNQKQSDKLPIVCLKNTVGSTRKKLFAKLQKHKVEYVYANGKIFVDRKDCELLDLLSIQICQMDGLMFSLDFLQPNPLFTKIKDYLNQHDAFYEIEQRFSKQEQKLIEYCVELVMQDKYQLKQAIQDIQIKRYMSNKMIASGLLLAKFEQLGLEFEFCEQKEFRKYRTTIRSPNLQKIFILTQPYYLIPQPIPNWPYLDYAPMLEKFIAKIEKTDFTNISYFFSDNPNQYTPFEQDLIFIADNWNIYSYKLQDRMKELQDIIDFKVFTIQDYHLIFPNIKRIVDHIKFRTGYTGQKKNVLRNVTDDITDTLYIHFFQEIQARTLRHSPFYIVDESKDIKLLLADVIASKIEYEAQSLQNSYWQDIFNKIRLHVKRIATASKLVDEKTSSDQRAHFQFTNNIEKQRLIDLGCISCCPIFYTDQNIYDPLVNKTPIELVSKITQLSDLQNDVKDKICYLLNNQGGVILFDVARKYRDYIPQGQIFSKKDQEAYIQKLEAIIQTISPKPVIRQNIEISFVPLVKNPILNPIKQKIQVKKTQNSFESVYYARPYVEGMFVTRIKVKPTTPWKTYYWTNGEKVIVPQKVNSFTIKAMSGRQIHKYMADKFRQHYIPQDLSEQQKQIREILAPRVSCFHSGKCTEPDAGLPIYQLKVAKQIDQDPEIKYPHMSLLIARKMDHQIIKQRLRRRGIDCQIVDLYKEKKFKAATNSAAIYHNVRFDHLLTEISYNRDFQFAGRYTMVIFISQFLKVPEYKRHTDLSEDSFKSLEKWVKSQHPKQEIKFWGYHNGESEQFYLQSQSRKSTVLMYYVMTEYREKCIFKNPKNFDKLTAEQKNKKIKMYYPKSGRKIVSYAESNQVEVQKIMHVQKLEKEWENIFWHDYLLTQLEQQYKQILLTMKNMKQNDREFQ